MATPKYFSYFPNIQYAQNVDRNGKIDYLEIKDYFHLLTVRDDVYREQTLYEKYDIKNGERPDQISYKFYGDEQFYWVILQLNGITDYYNEWPLSQFELEAFTTFSTFTTPCLVELVWPSPASGATPICDDAVVALASGPDAACVESCELPPECAAFKAVVDDADDDDRIFDLTNEIQTFPLRVNFCIYKQSYKQSRRTPIL